MQCVLLLHGTWLSALMLLTLASIHGRQHRGQLLAESLLDAVSEGGARAAAGAAGAHRAFTAAHACGEALQLPQVALLFLVKGPMHHEVLWRLWFESAAGLLPTDALAAALCSSNSSSGGNAASSSSSQPSAGERQRRVLQACSSRSGADGGVEPVDGGVLSDSEGVTAPQPGLAEEHEGQPLEEPAASPSHSSRLLQQAHSKHSATSNRAGTVNAGFVAPKGRAMPPASGVLGEQILFDVYVHPHPSFKGGLLAAGWAQGADACLLAKLRFCQCCCFAAFILLSIVHPCRRLPCQQLVPWQGAASH